MTYVIVLILITFSALFSGLTLGFFSLNKDDLERKAELGDKRAKKIFSVRKNGNLLLCTLLVGNVAINSALSIFLGSIITGVAAAFIATGLIVLFGEIMPQAFFARHALKFGSKFVWLAKIFIIMLFPVCWPVAKILDKMLGNEIPTIYSKKELVKLIERHEDLPQSDIDADEEKILKGGLSFSEKKVKDIMTAAKDITAIKAADIVNKKLIINIAETGHSRIPVYTKNIHNIIGILYVKDLIHHKLYNHKASDVARKNIIFVNPNKRLDDLLNDFKRTRNHLFVVRNKKKQVVGIVTIEDVIEEIIGSDIIDEFDYKEIKNL